MFQKNFLGHAAIFAGAAVLSAITAVSCMAKNDRETDDISEKGIFVMDTYCEITFSGGDTDTVSDLLYELDGCFDRFNENSEVAKLNGGDTLLRNAKTAALIENTLSLQERYKGGVDITSGALISLWNIMGEDPHVPSEQEISAALETVGKEHVRISEKEISLGADTKIDLGAVAKGYALDCVKEQLDASGARYGVVSMTSSMLLYGEKPEGEPFRIAVRGADDGEILGTAEVGSCFLSTSGGYERYFTDEDGKTYSHILDPETGYPSETDLETVTVFCDSGLLSDYLSTLIYMDGTKSIEEHLNADEYKLVAADKDGNIYVSDGLDFIYE